MEGIASGSDVDDGDAPFPHAVDDGRAESGGGSAPAGAGTNCHHLESSGDAIGDVPADVSEDLGILLCQRDAPAVFRPVQRGHFFAVVVLPVRMIMGCHFTSVKSREVFLKKGSERLDCQIDQSGEVRGFLVADEHNASPSLCTMVRATRPGWPGGAYRPVGSQIQRRVRELAKQDMLRG